MRVCEYRGSNVTAPLNRCRNNIKKNGMIGICAVPEDRKMRKWQLPCLNESGTAQTSIEKSVWGSPLFMWAEISQRRGKYGRVWGKEIILSGVLPHSLSAG